MKALMLAVLAVLGVVAALGAARAETGYDGGFFVDGEKGDAVYRIRFHGNLQTRFTLELFEAEEADDIYRFAVQRGRVGFDGYFLSKALEYKLQAAFDQGKAGLKDYYLDYAFADGVQLRAGQFKKPFSRQQINSSTRLALVDRAATDKAFGAGRDIGLMLHGDYDAAAGFIWAVGLVNGTGEGVVPDQFQPSGVVRVGYASEGFGKGQYSEGDLECAADAEACGLRWAVGASVEADGSLPDDGDKGQVVGEVDFILKVSGLELNGAFFVDYDLGSEDEGGGMDKLGFHAQLSYFFAGPRLLPALRFASVMPDDDAVATTRDLTLGIGLLPGKHNVKWMTDVTMAMSEVGDTSATDWIVRSQVQLAF